VSFAGRSDEIGRLARLVAGAGQGQAGTIIVVGEPGVGKTALVHEA
jgi:Cdc6-like AAA superfamily ATPase